MHRISPQAEVDERETTSSMGFHEFIEDSSNSALAKYQELVIGDRNLWHLFKYETLTLFLTNLPGLLGLFLRAKLYRFLLDKVGEGTIIGTEV